MSLLLKYDKPTCQDPHKKKFDAYDFSWKLIYSISRIATYETKTCIFQYKLLNNVLNNVYLNKKLFHFSIIFQFKYSFCELYDETPQHRFYECTYSQNLWNKLLFYLSEKVALPVLNPQSAIFGFTGVLDNNYPLDNLMKGNPDKCHLLVSISGKIKMEIGDFEIENSTCEKLLGVHFDNRLTIDYHILGVCTEARKKINAIARVC